MAVAHWDAHARVYERVWERSTLLWGRDALVLAQLPTATRLLDVACGSGALAVHAARLGLDVTAVDASSAMIQRLHAKLATAETAGLKVSPRVADGHTLDGLDDASFQAVGSNFGIFLFPDRGAAWASVWRVLAPGGVVFATSWYVHNFNVRLIRYLMETAEDKPAEEASTVGAFVVAPAINRMMEAASFREELAEHGFERIQIHTVAHAMCFHSGEEFVTGVLDNQSFLAMVGHKQETSLMWCILEFARCELGSGDDIGVTTTTGNPETHSLWRKAFALPAVAHIAVASKPWA